MARKAVAPKQEYEKTVIWNTPDIKAGEEIEGVYLRKEVFQGKFGTSCKYVLDCEGTLYGIYGSASLDRQFALVDTGTKVYVTYKGMTTSKNGRPVKEYIVEVDA